jgi:hypothetical protein
MGMAATAPAEASKVCACGCGQRVKRLQSVYRPGHNPRVPRPRRKGEWRPCSRQGCSNEIWLFLYESARPKVCSRKCANLRRFRASSWNALQVRLMERLEGGDYPSFAAICRAAALPDDTIRAWFRAKGSSLHDMALRALAEFLQIPMAQALRESGGRTAEEVAREHGRQMAERNFPRPGTPEARAAALKGGKARKGPHTSAHTANIMASLKRTGGLDRAVKSLIAGSRSLKGRLAHDLYGRLRHNCQPSKVNLESWAADVGAKRGLSASAILAIWRPYLRQRGLPFGGRGPMALTDHPYICELRRQRADLMWRDVAADLGLIPMPKILKSLHISHRQWHRRHGVPSCRPP